MNQPWSLNSPEGENLSFQCKKQRTGSIFLSHSCLLLGQEQESICKCHWAEYGEMFKDEACCITLGLHLLFSEVHGQVAENEGAVSYSASRVCPLGLNGKYIKTQWLTTHKYFCDNTEQNFGLLLPK